MSPHQGIARSPGGGASPTLLNFQSHAVSFRGAANESGLRLGPVTASGAGRESIALGRRLWIPGSPPSVAPRNDHTAFMVRFIEFGLAGRRPLHQTIKLSSDIIERCLLQFVGGRPVHQGLGCARLNVVVDSGAPDR